PNPDPRDHISYMNGLLLDHLMYAIFPHLARTLEGLGQGWVSYRHTGDASDALISTTEAVIRQLGTRRLHNHSPFFFPGDDERLRASARKYVEARGLVDVPVQRQLK